jgi:2-phospho-L-lactate transferase/gluconeogenesis factor (CofD/UPF0052 family)
MNKAVEIVVFSGGRGTKAVQESLSGIDNVRVTYLINGYDSGLSTGEVRRLIPGMLGPSDFRKALSGISVSYGTKHAVSLSSVFEFRLPLDYSEANSHFERLGVYSDCLKYINEVDPNLPLSLALDLVGKITKFAVYAKENHQAGFDPRDLALGNAYFGGAFLETSSFNDALDCAKNLFALPEHVDILNVTQGDDLWLAVSTDESDLCVEEGHFVTIEPPAPINEVFLIDRDDFLKTRRKYSVWNKCEASELLRIKACSVSPAVNPSVLDRLAVADVIVYGSGTLHSSLLPSYLTDSVRSALAKNTNALKVLFVNGVRDVDLHSSVERDATFDLYAQYLADGNTNDLKKYIVEAWLSGGPWDAESSDKVTGASSIFEIPLVSVTESKTSKYSPQESYAAFNQALLKHIGLKLASKSNIASLVIPILNEATKLADFQVELSRLNKTGKGSIVEKIVVDGGSQDGSLEVLGAWPEIRLIVASTSRIGRGAAIACGIKEAHGSTIAVFHADNEYQVSDVANLLELAESNPGTIYIGSRTHGAGGSFSLRRVYAGKAVQYWISRAGGVLISAIMSVRMGRSISDPFSGIFACDSTLAKKYFESDGDTDSFVRGLLAAHRQGIPIVEVGVSHTPRARSDGKKTNAISGLRSLIAAMGPIK